MDVLIATWQAGGATQAALGAGARLAARGHRVRLFAPAALEARARAAGCELVPSPAALQLDARRSAEQQWDVVRQIFFGRELADAFARELERDRPDVAVVDYLLRSVIAAAERAGLPAALLVTTLYAFHGGAGDDDATRERWYEPVNASRVELGLEPLPTGPDSVTVALLRRAAAGIVVVPREVDGWDAAPPHVVHVGPLTDGPPDPSWEAPWPADDPRPLAVVTLGTTYMEQERVLERVASALASLRLRVLVCTGSDLEPGRVRVPPGVELHGYVPHAAVLPHASVVVCHAGTGTLLAAFAAGAPVVCLPLGRDQPANARRVGELGLGRSVSADAGVDEIRSAVAAVLADARLRERAAVLARAMARYEDAGAAIERVLAGALAGRPK